MAIVKKGSAQWEGGLKDGKGSVSTESGALSDQPYGFNTRFEDKPGTNPEELIGAAHAACFTMAMSLGLGEEGLTATSLKTTAAISLEKEDGGFRISKSALSLTAEIPGIDEAKFREIAEKTKVGCPVSKLLDCEITLEADLRG